MREAPAREPLLPPYLEASQQGRQKRSLRELVLPGRLKPDDVPQQREGGQPRGGFAHVLVHLVQEVLRVGEDREVSQ